ncbi:MAG: DUF3179 domain-containing protein [Alphaproteobacteria bacterium]|nr:DUF3179 domain-containing protein [Alphaproteobacteria bacterium]
MWVESDDLIGAMRTFGTVENRGYLLVPEASQRQDVSRSGAKVFTPHQIIWSVPMSTTLWGTPVVGPLVGKGIVLDCGSVVTTTWGEWRRRHPGTKVLSLETGHTRHCDESGCLRFDEEVIEDRALLPADLQGILEARGHEDPRGCALLLDYRVGGNRGAEDEALHAVGLGRGLAEHVPDAGQNALSIVLRRGYGFGDTQSGAGMSQHHVGEGPTHVHADDHSLCLVAYCATVLHYPHYASCGETVSLSLWDGRAAVIVEQILGNRAIAHVALPGRRVPAHCTAAGKVLLAHCPKVEREAVFAEGLKSYTPQSVTEPNALRRELERLRQVGYALNDQEYEAESCGAASPLYDRHGEVVAAVTVAVPKHRFGAAARRILFEQVRRAAAEASRNLGYREGPGDC